MLLFGICAFIYHIQTFFVELMSSGLIHPMARSDLGASAPRQAGPLPKAKRLRDPNDDDERSSWTHSQISQGPKSQGSGEEEPTWN